MDVLEGEETRKKKDGFPLFQARPFSLIDSMTERCIGLTLIIVTFPPQKKTR